MEKITFLLKNLLEATRFLLEATHGSQEDQIAECLKKRKIIMDEITPFLPLKNLTGENKRFTREIIATDRKATAAMNALLTEVKEEINEQNKKNDGLIQYLNSYNVSGRLFDKSR